jgi:hypothetical protein
VEYISDFESKYKYYSKSTSEKKSHNSSVSAVYLISIPDAKKLYIAEEIY